MDPAPAPLRDHTGQLGRGHHRPFLLVTAIMLNGLRIAVLYADASYSSRRK